MELRYCDSDVVRTECASLINRCDKYMLLHPQSKLWLRDTDHTYNSIRLESENVTIEDYKDLTSTCPRCGSNIHIKYGYYEDYGLLFCEYCQSLVCNDGWEKLNLLLSYLDRIDLTNKNEDQKGISFLTSYIKKLFDRNKPKTSLTVIPNYSTIKNQELASRYRLRVLDKNKQLLYLTLNRIRMDEGGDLYIDHNKDKSDKVQFAGIYLNGRDINDQRLFQGDIVRFKFKEPVGRFSNWEGVLVNRKQENDNILYIVEDNIHNNFPPSPNWIDNNTIEVIGNIFEMPDYRIMGGEEAKNFAYVIRSGF